MDRCAKKNQHDHRGQAKQSLRVHRKTPLRDAGYGPIRITTRSGSREWLFPPGSYLTYHPRGHAASTAMRHSASSILGCRRDPCFACTKHGELLMTYTSLPSARVA